MINEAKHIENTRFQAIEDFALTYNFRYKDRVIQKIVKTGGFNGSEELEMPVSERWLQQMWQGSNGTQKWEWVEYVK